MHRCKAAHRCKAKENGGATRTRLVRPYNVQINLETLKYIDFLALPPDL